MYTEELKLLVHPFLLLHVNGVFLGELIVIQLDPRGVIAHGTDLKTLAIDVAVNELRFQVTDKVDVVGNALVVNEARTVILNGEAEIFDLLRIVYDRIDGQRLLVHGGLVLGVEGLDAVKEHPQMHGGFNVLIVIAQRNEGILNAMRALRP